MIRALDIFSGAGGSSAGARSAGVEIVGAIDMDPVATKTYAANFPDTAVMTGRVEELLQSMRRQVGEVDLLMASPECTNHSCAKGAAPRCEDSRATAMQVAEYAKVFKPRWIVMENVIQMRPWARYAELKSDLANLGYNLAEHVLDSSLFGVPQKRRRLIVVADRERVPKPMIPKRSRKRIDALSILDDADSWPTNMLHSNNRAQGTLDRAARAIKELGGDSPFLIVYYGSDGAGGWQTLDQPLRTVTTVDRFALVSPGSNGHQIRMLQVPELRRAMGFAKQYGFDFGTRRDKIRLLGNGVCPPVMKAVVEHLTSN